MTACPHDFPTPASCWDCMCDGNFVPGQFPADPAAEPFDAGDVVVSHTLKAQFPGWCAICHDPIVVADDIAALEGTTTRYAHDACVPGGGQAAPWARGDR